MEFGNGQGSGIQNRRGFQTTTPLPLNKWVHLAVTSTSVTKMHFYFNGVEQPKAATNGISTSVNIMHSSASASIGRIINFWIEYNMDGMVDEVRLWNISRTQGNIREFMCRKVDPSTSGLIGYWTADESYTSTTVNDNTIPAENGTVTGTVTKLTSGAPIGDTSKYLYTSNWSGAKIALTAPSDDEVTAKMITGTPAGVQVYRVDAAPHDAGGLSVTPSYYFGVFCAEANGIAGYKIVYDYSTSNGVINSGNESTAELMTRKDGSIITWTDLNATLDTSSNKLTRAKQKTGSEYILNLGSLPKLSVHSQSTNSSLSLSFFPNPATEKITLLFPDDGASISTIRITDLTGKVLKEMKVNGTERTVSIDVSHFESGTYIIDASTSSGWKVGKFEVQK
jgi:hypothetical protein